MMQLDNIYRKLWSPDISKEKGGVCEGREGGITRPLAVRRTTCIVSSLVFAAIIGVRVRFRPNQESLRNVFEELSLLPTADINQTQLIYMHIAKTGGSTFNEYLRDLVGAQSLNCGNFKGCCDKRYTTLKNAKLLSGAVRDCGHYSYEETWPLPLDTGELHNPAYLTHVRTGVWHVLSMLGHGAKANRFDSYSPVLKNLTSGEKYPGYQLVNFQKSRFPHSMGVSEVIELLTKKFFWVGLTDKYEQSLCLLHYQLGIFNHDQCKHMCASLANSRLMEEDPLGATTSINETLTVSKRNANHKEEHQTLSQAEIKLLRSISNEDQLIYEAMLELFHRRSAIVEERVGFRFANCHLPLTERFLSRV